MTFYVKIRYRTKRLLGEWSTTLAAPSADEARQWALRTFRRRHRVVRIDSVEVK